MKKRIVLALLALLTIVILAKMEFAMIKMPGLFYARANISNVCVVAKFHQPKNDLQITFSDNCDF